MIRLKKIRSIQIVLLSASALLITGAAAVAQCPAALTFAGEAASNFFGLSVSGAGDVNNDGFADLIMGAPGNFVGGSQVGRAYVFSGQTGDTLHVFTGEAALDEFGISVSGAGDVNNDGFADLIVGAWFNDAGGNDAGRAYVYSGQTGALLHTFTGEAADDLFGHSVSGVGDANNDGFDDIIVGASYNDAGGTRAGRAYVYSGQTGALLHTLTGEAVDDQFGISVSGAGDVNNDGRADLIVGSRFNDAGGTEAGRAYVYSGQTGTLLHIFTGKAVFDHFGRSVSGAGDVNNDGYDDLIVGSRLDDAGETNAGRADVYSGQTGALLHTFTGEAAVDGFGYSVSGAGDVNNDGFADLIIGAESNDAGGVNAGRAYVFSGIACNIPGDADDGGDVNILDATYIVNYIFQDGAAPPCCNQADADGSGELNVGDAILIVMYIFQGGDPPSRQRAPPGQRDIRSRVVSPTQRGGALRELAEGVATDRHSLREAGGQLPGHGQVGHDPTVFSGSRFTRHALVLMV
ncbi:MAG: FG-GAP repeat protein [candidate division Zixibacteria bacterium]|nr:FG-GAP repeat protein [candidate division Zixibacteria bacterium]